MTREQQRQELTAIVTRAKEAGLKIRWSNAEIVVIGLPSDDGGKQETGDQPVHGETGKEGRSEDRPDEGA